MCPPVEDVDLEVALLAGTHVAAVGAVPAPVSIQNISHYPQTKWKQNFTFRFS